MDKPAETRHPIHELLRNRWSPRAFSGRRVERSSLLQLFEAARWAASCFNEQPWSFIAAAREDGEPYERLLACLTDRNRSWASHAPVLMLSVAKRRFDSSGRANRYAMHDVGLAVGNLIVQAGALNLSVHQMAGFQPDQARASFDIPESHDPVAMIAVGYRGEADDLPEEFRERERAPRVRKPLESFVYSGNWGAVPKWISESGAVR